jgi:hypothetical protein
MVMYHAGSGLWLDDSGTRTLPCPTTLPPGSRMNGEPIDRGWVVYRNGTSVMLRESALTQDTDTLSTSAGGAVTLRLEGGAARAGMSYALLMSLSGAHPGMPIGSVTVPLNDDGLPAASLSLANSSILVNSLGTLSASGSAWARFHLPPGLLRAIAGRYLTFAWVAASAGGVEFASNPARVKLAP